MRWLSCEINVKGAIFCKVISTIHCSQGVDCITEGNQKWRGAAPTFKRSANNIITCGKKEEKKFNSAPTNNMAEPRACVKKYFRVASEDKIFFLFVSIIGIKDNKLSSNPTQAVTQLGEEVVIKIPKIRVLENKKEIGQASKIKKRSITS